MSNLSKRPDRRLAGLFANPPPEYAPTAFWFWNEPLDLRWLRWQARELAAKGVRGFFIHARSGIPREQYFAPIWWRAVGAAVQEARRVGAYAWLYDELGWPSGSAGGRVPARGPEYQQHYLECVVGGENPSPAGELVARAALPDGRSLLFVQQRTGGIDALNPKVVAAFIEETHERYLRRFGKDFGKLIPGIFTDEPSMRVFALRTKEMKIAWSPRLPEEFRRRLGYDLLEHLPSLFFDVGEYTAVRNDFYRTVAELFREAYGKQIYKWCDRHGLAYTGHYEYEGPMRMQIQCLGATMPLYRYMHIPGLDQLARWRVVHERRETLVLTKQVTSVAEQTGKQRALCEAFGVGGWDFPPRELRWMADWLFLLGISLLSPHGYYSSIAGERKRDAPPDQFWRQPWWPISKSYHDHCARLCAALSQGRSTARVLIIHPVTSAWVDHRPQDHSGRGDWEDDPLGLFFNRMCEAVLEAHHEFHLGDDALLAEFGKVRGKRLIVGECAYDAVVLPPMKNLGKATAQLLAGFVQRGGALLRLRATPALHWTSAEGEPPLVEGRESGPLTSVLLRTPKPRSTDEDDQIASLVRRLAQVAPRFAQVRTRPVASARRVNLTVREISPSSRLVFLLNASREPKTATVSFAGRWRIERWLPATGERMPVATSQPAVRQARGQTTSLSLSFAPQESCLLHLQRGTARARSRVSARGPGQLLLRLNEGWEAAPKAGNILLLDRCRYREQTQGARGRWHTQEPIFVLRRERREGARTPAVMEFTFHVDAEAAGGPLGLAIEEPNRFRIRLNGRAVPIPRRAGFFLDRARKVLPLAKVLPGDNALTLEPLDNDAPLEDLYLLGRFAVRKHGRGWVMTSLARRIALGNWCPRGFPFLTGPLSYRTRFELPRAPSQPVCLDLGEVREACSVYVNGRHAGDLLWPPFEVEVGRLLRRGRNELEVVVYGSLRNLLGPHYAKNEDQRGGFGNQDFEPSSGYDRPHCLRPMGLFGPVRLRS